MILDETGYLQEHLEEKRVHYIPVANHGAKLFEIIQRVAVLSPYYFLSLKTFHRLYLETIKARHRGKGSTGQHHVVFSLSPATSENLAFTP